CSTHACKNPGLLSHFYPLSFSRLASLGFAEQFLPSLAVFRGSLLLSWVLSVGRAQNILFFPHRGSAPPWYMRAMLTIVDLIHLEVIHHRVSHLIRLDRPG